MIIKIQRQTWRYNGRVMVEEEIEKKDESLVVKETTNLMIDSYEYE